MTFGRPQSIRQDYELEELPLDVDFETLGSEIGQDQSPTRAKGSSVVDFYSIYVSAAQTSLPLPVV